MKNLLLIPLLIFSSTLYSQNKDLIAIPENLLPKDRICFALYTVHENSLKLTAQFYPMQDNEPFYATLEIFENGNWVEKVGVDIIYPGYTAQFRINNWDDSKEAKYRVVHNNKAFYEGIIKKNPIDQEEFVVATFSCNSHYPNHGGDIPKKDILDNIKKIDPDLLFFSGDQVYDHSAHYLNWLKFGREYGDIIRNIPTICIPDDHDVGQGNLWGAGGGKATERRGISGGFYMPAEYVNEVQRAQTSHLPDPFDPTPIKGGIGVYYTDLKWGGMSFAIIEDRKFKSGLIDVAEQNPDVFKNGPTEALFDPSIDARKLDIAGVTLLGERQLKFLESWTTDWEDAEMKSVLSQTIFAMVNNYTGKHDKQIIADFDSNGWPQSGRNKALSVVRKSFSTLIAGDQHLGVVIQHGINNWNDAPYSFATPAIANLWLRWWEPDVPGKNRQPNTPNYTGEYLDGFQNKMTVHAAANPTFHERREGGLLSTRAAGFGVVRYQKTNRTITFECWPRNVDIDDPKNQYEGWPITVSQMDNFQIQDGYELPTLELSKADQVVTVLKAFTSEVIQSLRLKGQTYQPKVQEAGLYSIIIGEGKSQKKFHEIKALKGNKAVIKVSF